MDLCPKRWSRRKEARPHEILEAALELFAEKGYAATRIDEIAARAGVTRGTPYLYFAGKEEIFKALIQELLLPALDEAEAMLDGFEGSAAERLRRIVHVWWQSMGETRLSALPKLMVAEAGNFPEVAKLYNDLFIVRGEAIFRQVIEAGVASGEFRTVDVEYALHVLCAPVVMAMLTRYMPYGHAALDPLRYLDCLLDLMLHGLQQCPQSAESKEKPDA
ncbi:TetR/AcrR family transcriptional regulator [Jeongeupia naejangsanensis]|uniref:TetR/AcrR family transcriptional regulator n=1 Tax=Jeongeupia naejangsanensis TaxID=613195 RepID=A0ABS2BS18_9NEIS|nr:TetR/AcrR family transcriptional regulator [Jeongeupia naejangsanensis]MBM3117604.1 TetR/AcrR family transcriptional regulator [Jeongeupia naejangsanensis]